MSTATPSILHLTHVSENRYAVENHGDAETHNVVFGGQLLGQMIVAAARHSPDKYVKTINAIFARAGRVDAATEIQVETIHTGRAMASHTLTAWQGDRLCARALALATVAEPDLIDHQVELASFPDPASAGTVQSGGIAFPGAEYIVVGDVDVNDSSLPARPAHLDVLYRSIDTPDEQAANQAVLGWATDGFLIGTAMLPHEGVGQERAHVDISTGVIDHTLSFHRPFSLRDWVLLQHESPFAGAGRTHGRCLVYDRAGTLVASYVQENMVRAMPAGGAHKRM